MASSKGVLEGRLSSQSTTPAASDIQIEKSVSEDGFPEGGLHAWLTVAGAAACLFVSFGWVNCVGIFQDYYQSHQLRDYSPSEIAWIPSLQGK
jgi:hypothetical protein